jgi:hypothetical protein
MPRCAICGKRLGLKSEYVHMVTRENDEWYCAEHWWRMENVGNLLISLKGQMDDMWRALDAVDYRIRDLLGHLNRRRKGRGSGAARVVAGGPARAPAK